MADTAHILEQMREANPAPSLERLAVDDLDLVRDLVAHRRSAMTTPVKEPQHARPESPTPRPWKRSTLVAGLAGVVVLGTLGLVLLIFSSGGNGETAAGPVPAAEPTTSVAGVEAPAGPVIGPKWTLVSGDDAVFGPGAVRNVITIPDGFLAVGERCEGSRQCRAAIWRSPDGVEWTWVFIDPVGDPGAFSSQSTQFWDAAVGDLGYLAVGRTAHGWSNHPVFAFSADGVVWERFEPLPKEGISTHDPKGILLDTNTPLSVVAADDVFLVAGQSCASEEGREYDCWGVIWGSLDGRNWTKVLQDVRDSAFESIAQVGDRYLAVGGAGVGLDLESQWNEMARIWSSFNGITWTDVSSDPFVFGRQRPDPGAREYARAVTAVDAGFIVAGSQLDVPEGAIWFSADGTTWLPMLTNGVFDNATITGIAASGDQVIAVGVHGTQAAAWRSDDGGFTWERMDVDPALTGGNVQSMQVAIRGDIAVTGLSVDGRAAIWVAELGAQP